MFPAKIERAALLAIHLSLLFVANGRPEEPGKLTTRTRYEMSTKLILKLLKAPATARFSELGKDEEATLAVLAPDAWEAGGFVDSQNSFGALLRSSWRMVLKLEGDKPTLLYIKFGDDETGNLEAAKRETLPAAERTALAMAEKKHGEELAARKRADYHRQARNLIVESSKQTGPLQHSTLGEIDDQLTVCRQLKKDIWEAIGVIQTAATEGSTRYKWRVVFRAKDDATTDAIYWEFGNKKEGDLSGLMRDPELARALTYGPAKEQTKSEITISNRPAAAVDADKTPLGVYKK